MDIFLNKFSFNISTLSRRVSCPGTALGSDDFTIIAYNKFGGTVTLDLDGALRLILQTIHWVL